ncbi:MAG: penicillin-binding protein 2 [Persicimonas sp.]
MSKPSHIPRRARGGGIEDYQGQYFFLVVGFLLFFAALGSRLWYLQIVRGEDYYQASSENIIRDVDLPAPRGRIFDRHGEILAENRPSFDVYLLPRILAKHDQDQTLELLQRYMELSDGKREHIEERLAQNPTELLVRRDASRAQVAALETHRPRLPGVEVRASAHRHYPLDEVGAHTIGFLSEATPKEVDRLSKYGYNRGDYLGRMGLERSFEKVLSGSPGVDREVIDAHGMPEDEAQTRFLIGDYQRVDPVPGRDLVTTLDAALMEAIDDAMAEYPSGAVAAVDPRDGSVRALYSKPSINPNTWTGRLSSLEKMRTDNDPFQPMLDKTLNAYFPGSIYKIVASAAALEEGAKSPSSEATCRGAYQFGGRRFRCWKRGGHGKVDLVEALKHSCDVYFYQVAEKLGIDTLAEYAYEFGFGEPTGLPLASESSGRVPTREWHDEHSPDGYQYGFALNTVLGQGDTLTTPMQAAVAYAAVANGGKLYYPRLADSIENADGETIFEFPPKLRRRASLESETLEMIQQGLYAASNEEEGTSYKSRPDGIEMAGKTGTAQVHTMGAERVANRDKEFKLRDHAWFATYAPADDPEIVLVVFLEHAGSGGGRAAPVAKEILTSYFEAKVEREFGGEGDR